MMIPNHPDEERLSALASRDDDAITDGELTSHVSGCDQCTEVVDELVALRASLADLPDIAPHRPLPLLPPVADAPAADGAAGWVRRLFAPALTAGAAIAMVGLVGTASPLLQGAATGQAPFMDGEGAAQEVAAESLQERVLSSSAAAPAAGGETDTAAEPGASPEELAGQTNESAAPEDEETRENIGSDTTRQLPAERSPWPMVLFTGIALMVGAALLRWILVPRAG